MIGALIVDQLLGFVSGGLSTGLAGSAYLIDGLAMFGETFYWVLPFFIYLVRSMVLRRTPSWVHPVVWTLAIGAASHVFFTIHQELLETRIYVADHKYDAGNACVIDPRTHRLKTACTTLRVTSETWPIVIAIHNVFGAWLYLALEFVHHVIAWVKSGLWSMAIIAIGIGIVGRPLFARIGQTWDNKRRVRQHQQLDAKLAQLPTPDGDDDGM